MLVSEHHDFAVARDFETAQNFPLLPIQRSLWLLFLKAASTCLVYMLLQLRFVIVYRKQTQLFFPLQPHLLDNNLHPVLNVKKK